jgi:glutathione synthase
MLDGEPLMKEGHLAAIRRVPAQGDFRSNLHAGGSPEPAELSAEQRRTLSSAGPLLRQEGIRLAGVDLIGTRIIELNVYSTGGLRDAERFSDQDFCDAILARFEARESGAEAIPEQVPNR